MMPDNEGNTFLHMFANGTLKEKEFDFIKYACLKYNLRLTRNNQNKTALNIVKQFSGREFDLRGKPNYKRKMWEWCEMRIEEQGEVNFCDSN